MEVMEMEVDSTLL
jgi:hypothetical protein